uniref:Cement protein AWGH n=1 Tax=Pectinaria gouldii TaxID=260746 RepID=A0A0K1P2Z5_PECGU|nr:cement protein AWGH [Pectinaria gouldii]
MCGQLSLSLPDIHIDAHHNNLTDVKHLHSSTVTEIVFWSIYTIMLCCTNKYL